MRFDLLFREGVKGRLDKLASEMKEWEGAPRVAEAERIRIRESISSFGHTTEYRPLRIGGVDGSGDFPALAYADSFVYVTVAQGTVYEAALLTGLKEVKVECTTLFEFTWIPEEAERRRRAWDGVFETLAGEPIGNVIKRSDYRLLKAKNSGRVDTQESLLDGLLRPHAADSGNVGIQLRSTAEMGAALRLIGSDLSCDYVLLDGTLSLPMVTRQGVSLFYEHLKRLCCVEARHREIGVFCISKSHGLPSMEVIEQIARDVQGLGASGCAEHWFLRLPVPGEDSWSYSVAEERHLPPPGAVTYLVRFHHNTPVLRLDMDLEYWRAHVRGTDEATTRQNECRIFQALDYASHDQRCYGYPYPIKAGHDRASMTQAERVALRKQIIEAAVRAGMKRSLFRDASLATGHE